MAFNFKEQKVKIIKEGKAWDIIGVQPSAMELVPHEQDHVPNCQRLGGLYVQQKRKLTRRQGSDEQSPAECPT